MQQSECILFNSQASDIQIIKAEATDLRPTPGAILKAKTKTLKILFGVNICFIPKTLHLPSDSNCGVPLSATMAPQLLLNDNHIPFYITHILQILSMYEFCARCTNANDNSTSLDMHSISNPLSYLDFFTIRLVHCYSAF